MRPDLRIEAFILAGGKSSRMGRDKGLVLLKGRPMISYVLEALGKVKLPIKIIANDASYKSFGLPVVGDVVNEKGPMGGLHTAFQHTQADVAFLISCDMPLISVEAVENLIAEANKVHIVAASVENKVNPLFALYPVGLKALVEENIFSDQLKMTELILTNTHTLVPSIAERMPWCFQNINNKIELKKIEEKWNHLL